MPRTILIDANVIDHLNRGNGQAAQALKRMIAAGDKVFIAQQAYAELTSQPGKAVAGIGPDLPRTAAANAKLLSDLGISVAPAGNLADRAAVYERNGTGPSVSQSDMMIVAQARALKAEVWSFDKAFRNGSTTIATTFGVTVAPESQSAYASPGSTADYRTARSLMGLPKVDISVGGHLKTSPTKPPKGSGTSGGGGGGSAGRSGTTAVVGTPDMGPPDIGPSPSRGEKIGNAVELGLSGYNFVIQRINDSIQADRVKAAWSQMKPHIERRLADDPSLGVLILVRFGRRQKQGSEHDSPLEHTSQFLSIETEYGLTETEAWEAYVAQPRLSAGAGLDITVQRTFIPPKNSADVSKLRTPFTSYGVGTFVSGRAALMRVAWKGVFGFDEIGDVKLSVPDGMRPRFLLLLAPNTITWFNGGIRKTTDVPVEWRAAGSAAPHTSESVAVVDMDRGVFNVGNDAAAMVFPADAATARLFETVAPTKDNTGQLTRQVNFDKVRWVRPRNIHVLRTFMEESVDTVRADKPVHYAPKESPRLR